VDQPAEGDAIGRVAIGFKDEPHPLFIAICGSIKYSE
jgi:hypothetical protein